MGATWFVRATDDPLVVAQLLEAGMVGLALDAGGGEEALLEARDTLVARVTERNPDWPGGQAATFAREFYRYVNLIELDDQVVLRDGANRRYLVGTVMSPAALDPGPVPSLPYVRQINWTHRVARDRLPVRARHGLGALDRVQLLGDEVCEELGRAAVRIDAPPSGELVISSGWQPQHAPARAGDDISVTALRAELEARAGEFVEDMLVALEPMELQAMLAGVLRAMGYRNRVSHEMRTLSESTATFEGNAGASAPTMMVELRHEADVPVDADTVRAFIEGKHLRVRCLFLSTGGFTADARALVGTTDVDLELIGLPELRQLVLEHYKFMDMESRALIPLRPLFWPTPD